MLAIYRCKRSGNCGDDQAPLPVAANRRWRDGVRNSAHRVCSVGTVYLVHRSPSSGTAAESTAGPPSIPSVSRLGLSNRPRRRDTFEMNHCVTVQLGHGRRTFFTGIALLWILPVIGLPPFAFGAMPESAVSAETEGVRWPTTAAGQSTTQTRRSLNRAADTLKRAANVLDKNENLAVQYIREAISILRHEVLAPLGLPEAEATAAPPAATETPGETQHPVRSAAGEVYRRAVTAGAP